MSLQALTISHEIINAMAVDAKTDAGCFDYPKTRLKAQAINTLVRHPISVHRFTYQMMGRYKQALLYIYLVPL